MVRIAVLAAVVAVGLVPSALGSAPAGEARLLLLDRSPLTVRGARFHAGEAVKVRAVVRGGPRLTKLVTADRHGTFRARFVSLSLGACAFFSVQATGARGSKAAITIFPPLCGPPP